VVPIEDALISGVRIAAPEGDGASISRPEDACASAPANSPRGAIADRYRVVRTLASGGMGVVYACDDTVLGRRVAVKVMHRAAEDGDGPMRERFLQEGRLLARVDSPHVARLFDHGLDEQGEPYLVMELLEGRDLCELLAEQGALPPPAVIQYVSEACEGLREVHRHHIVHRDLKPENLVVCAAQDGSDILKIVDFGISEQLGGTDRASTTSGSPNYMAPEQLMTPSEHGVQADIWSLGVVMYELLTGRLPFERAKLLDILDAVMHAAPTPMSEFRPEIPSALQDIVSKCLEKDPTRRYQSVDEVARALREVADAAGLASSPPVATGIRHTSTATRSETADDASSTQPIELLQRRVVTGRSEPSRAIKVAG
jgi:serine/threonine protein kinase